MGALDYLLKEHDGVVRLGGLIAEGGEQIQPSSGRVGGAFRRQAAKPAGRFIEINDGKTDVEGKGYICERLLASTYLFPNEPGSVSYIVHNGRLAMSLDEAIKVHPHSMLGGKYLAQMNERWKEGGLTFLLLAKLLDKEGRSPAHIHHIKKTEAHILLSPNGYEYKAGFIGHIVGMKREEIEEALTNEVRSGGLGGVYDLMEVKNLSIGDAFFVPTGMVHAPAGFLLEVQTRDDDIHILEGSYEVNGVPFGETAMRAGASSLETMFDRLDWTRLRMVAYEGMFLHKPDKLIEGSKDGVRVRWASPPNRADSWCVKHVVIGADQYFEAEEISPYAIYVHKGKGNINGFEATADNFKEDEFFVTGESKVRIENKGRMPMEIYLLFPEGAYREKLHYTIRTHSRILRKLGVDPMTLKL